MTNYKKRSFTFNIITSFITKFIVLFGGFIISVLMARLLGPEGKGVIVSLLVIPTLVATLARLGIKKSIAYFIGRSLYNREDIISSAVVLWCVSSVISTTVVAIYFFGVLSSEYHWLLLLIILLTVPLKITDNYAGGVFEGQEQIGKVNIKKLMLVSLEIFGIIFFIWLLDLYVLGAAIVQLLIILTVTIYSLYHVNKNVPIKFQYIPPIPQELSKHGLRFALAFFIMTLIYQVDIVILERMVDAEQVGLYSTGASLAQLIWAIPSAITVVLFARSANSKTDHEAVGRSTLLLRIVLPTLLFFCFLFFFFADYFIPIVYGEAFSESAIILKILLPGVWIIVMSKILHSDLQGRGYPLYAVWAFISPLILNIILNIYWIPIYGIVGAAWASTTSYTVGAITYGIIYARKHKIPFTQLILLRKEDVQLLKTKVMELLNRKKRKKSKRTFDV